MRLGRGRKRHAYVEGPEQDLFEMTAAPRPMRFGTAACSRGTGRGDPQMPPPAANCSARARRALAELRGWQRLGDAGLFDQLRVDPYDRTLAAARPEMTREIKALIDSLRHILRRGHADFKPKNCSCFTAG